MKNNFWNEEEMSVLIIEYNAGKIENKDVIAKNVLRLSNHIIATKRFVSNMDKDDLVQDATIRVLDKLHLWDLSKGKSYSYIYKIISMKFLYDLRERNRIRLRKHGYEVGRINSDDLYYTDKQDTIDDAFNYINHILNEETSYTKTQHSRLKNELNILRNSIIKDANIVKVKTVKIRKYIKNNKEIDVFLHSLNK